MNSLQSQPSIHFQLISQFLSNNSILRLFQLNSSLWKIPLSIKIFLPNPLKFTESNISFYSSSLFNSSYRFYFLSIYIEGNSIFYYFIKNFLQTKKIPSILFFHSIEFQTIDSIDFSYFHYIPITLKEINFGDEFNQILLPSYFSSFQLEKIIFGKKFNKKIEILDISDHFVNRPRFILSATYRKSELFYLDFIVNRDYIRNFYSYIYFLFNCRAKRDEILAFSHRFSDYQRLFSKIDA